MEQLGLLHPRLSRSRDVGYTHSIRPLTQAWEQGVCRWNEELSMSEDWIPWIAVIAVAVFVFVLLIGC